MTEPRPHTPYDPAHDCVDHGAPHNGTREGCRMCAALAARWDGEEPSAPPVSQEPCISPVPWAIALQPTELGYAALVKSEPCATAIGWECAPTPPPLVRWRETRDPEVWSPVSLRLWEDGKVVETGVSRARQVINARDANYTESYHTNRDWKGLSTAQLRGFTAALALGDRLVALGLARMVFLDLVDGEVRERDPSSTVWSDL